MSTIDESSIANVADSISNALEASDEQTAQRLQTLSLVHQARVSQLTRYAATVTARYGAASPQAKAAQATVAASQGAAARLGVVTRQLNTPVPNVPAGGWVLHGRVYDDQAAAVPRQTVFLVDAQGIFHPEYGFAYTNDTGYFVLTAEGTGAAPPAEGDVSTPATVPELYVEVTNENRQPVYLSSTAFQPTAGTANYVNVYAGEKPIGEPPGDIQKSAPPSPPGSGKSLP